MGNRYFLVRLATWGGAVIFLAILGLRDLGLSRQMRLEARLDQNTPRLSVFGPPARVELATDQVRVIGEPVYFSVLLPRWYRAVEVEISYPAKQNDDFSAIRLGPRTHPKEWQYNLVNFSDAADTMAAESSVGDGETMNVVTIPFTLNRFWQVERNIFQFILSVPGVSSERPFIIRSLNVIAKRDPICLGRFCV